MRNLLLFLKSVKNKFINHCQSTFKPEILLKAQNNQLVSSLYLHNPYLSPNKCPSLEANRIKIRRTRRKHMVFSPSHVESPVNSSERIKIV